LERRRLEFYLDGKPAQFPTEGIDLGSHRLSVFDANGEIGLRLGKRGRRRGRRFGGGPIEFRRRRRGSFLDGRCRIRSAAGENTIESADNANQKETLPAGGVSVQSRTTGR
jgi:hypothetical protein